jgi:hypothetical protein
MNRKKKRDVDAILMIRPPKTVRSQRAWTVGGSIGIEPSIVKEEMVNGLVQPSHSILNPSVSSNGEPRTGAC